MLQLVFSTVMYSNKTYTLH